MYLIDTDVVIWALRANTTYQSALQTLKDQGPLYISTVTIAEIYKNVFPAETTVTEQVLQSFENWDVTPEIAKHAGLYWQQYAKSFRSLNIIDCIIAATAREYDLTLFTLNSRHYPMQDIRLYKV